MWYICVMKNLKKVLFAIFIITAYSPIFAKDNSTQVMYVSLDPAPLKEKASAASKDLGSLDYATPVFILEEKKTWIYVSAVENADLTGWIPSTSVTRKKLKANEIAATANADEIALAGKGFCSAIEAVYADEYNIDYRDVNYIEEQAIKDYDEILDFIYEGGLFISEVD